MAEYIAIEQLWKCETCYHNDQYGCNLGLGCDHGENYRPAYSKLKKADVSPVVRCRECKHFSRFQNTNWCEVFDDGYYSPDDNDFCSRGTKDGE